MVCNLFLLFLACCCRSLSLLFLQILNDPGITLIMIPSAVVLLRATWPKGGLGSWVWIYCLPKPITKAGVGQFQALLIRRSILFIYYSLHCDRFITLNAKPLLRYLYDWADIQLLRCYRSSYLVINSERKRRFATIKPETGSAVNPFRGNKFP